MKHMWKFCQYYLNVDEHYMWFLSADRYNHYPQGATRVLISLTNKYTKELGWHLEMNGYSVTEIPKPGRYVA